MLTRESQLSLGEAIETGYVGGKATKARQDASSVLPAASVDSRQSGSGTQRVHTDDLSGASSTVCQDLPLTVPRGDASTANARALSEKSEQGGNSFVFVLSKNKTPLMPTRQSRAQELLKKGRAVVHKLFPFTIRLKDRKEGAIQPTALKLDPGSKSTGVALCRVGEDGTLHPLFFGEIQHRGWLISKKLKQRSGYRRRRRSANLRYRPPRFDNRTKPEGWLAPSLQHRVDSTLSVVSKLRNLSPVSEIASELVRFDMQALENPEIEGAQYQQGTLAGYEVREYLLEKWNRACTYCGVMEVPLQIEHIEPKARGGSNRISNLCLACAPCNQAKGAMPIQVFLKRQPKLLKMILNHTKKPLRDAAAVNSTRWALVKALKATGLPVSTGSGGRTKWNRVRLGIPKTHCLDALCVGNVIAVGRWSHLLVLQIKSTGRGSYQRTRVYANGFPRGKLTREKGIFGFQTGDIVRAVVPHGKKAGTHVGRIAIRASGSFNIETLSGLLQGISHNYFTRLARNDGYQYNLRTVLPPHG